MKSIRQGKMTEITVGSSPNSKDNINLERNSLSPSTPPQLCSFVFKGLYSLHSKINPLEVVMLAGGISPD